MQNGKSLCYFVGLKKSINPTKLVFGKLASVWSLHKVQTIHQKVVNNLAI